MNQLDISETLRQGQRLLGPAAAHPGDLPRAAPRKRVRRKGLSEDRGPGLRAPWQAGVRQR